MATDEAGLADVTNIVARMQGLVMLSQAWTAASGARTIQFTISTANSQNLAGNHASRNHLDFEIDFRDASNTVVTDRHLAIDVLASTPATDRGLTAEQEALLLPTFPATGSRDNKVPKFSGDTLGWEEDESVLGVFGLDGSEWCEDDSVHDKHGKLTEPCRKSRLKKSSRL